MEPIIKFRGGGKAGSIKNPKSYPSYPHQIQVYLLPLFKAVCSRQLRICMKGWCTHRQQHDPRRSFCNGSLDCPQEKTWKQAEPWDEGSWRSRSTPGWLTQKGCLEAPQREKWTPFARAIFRNRRPQADFELTFSFNGSNGWFRSVIARWKMVEDLLFFDIPLVYVLWETVVPFFSRQFKKGRVIRNPQQVLNFV